MRGNSESHQGGSDSEVGLMSDVVVAISSLEKPQLNFARNTCSRLGAVCKKELTAQTTHLVIKKAAEGGGQLVAQRTLKYLEAISRGLWIVDFEWIEKCALLGKRVPEAPFEILGELVCGIDHMGPRIARERRLKGNDPLFAKCTIYCPAEFSDMGLDVVERLFTNAGGNWASTRHSFKSGSSRRRKIILVDTELTSAVTSIADECKLPLINREWFLDSLTRSQLLSRKDYILYQGKSGHVDLEKTLSHA